MSASLYFFSWQRKQGLLLAHSFDWFFSGKQVNKEHTLRKEDPTQPNPASETPCMQGSSDERLCASFY